MKFVLILLILLKMDFTSSGKIQNVEFTAWSDLKYMLVTINKTRTKEDMVFSLIFNQTVDFIVRQNIRLTVSVADGANDRDFNRVLSENTVDVCKMSSILKSSLVVRSIIGKLLDCVKEDELKCPYKRGPIFLSNCKVSSISLPDVWPTDVNFKVTMKTKAKLPTKKWVDLWNIDIFGLYKGSLSKF